MHFAIDRIEEGLAVLVGDDGSRLHLPVGLLPEGAGEGQVLRLSLEIDHAETAERAGRVRDLQRRLLNRDDD